MLLGALPAADPGDEERRRRVAAHRLPLRLHGHVPLRAAAAAPGRARPATRGSARRHRRDGAPRRRPRRSGEHGGGDQRGESRREPSSRWVTFDVFVHLLVAGFTREVKHISPVSLVITSTADVLHLQETIIFNC